VAGQKYQDATKVLPEFDKLKAQYPDNPALAEDEVAIRNAIAGRLEEHVKDSVLKIRTVVADNKDFTEARGMIERLEQQLATSDPDMVAVVKSFTRHIRNELYAAELADLEQRIGAVLDQLSPYGVAVTSQLRAGNTPTFSTVKLITEGRTNLTKARAQLEGINAHVAGIAKESDLLDRPLRSRLTALEATTNNAKQTVDAGLSRAGSAIPLAYGAVAVGLLGLGGAVFLLVRRKKSAPPA
jgi:hypothetical protein